MAFREDMISSSASCSGSEEEDEFDERGAAGGYDPMAGGWKSLHSAISRASLRQLTRTEKSGSTGFKAKSCTATRARHEGTTTGHSWPFCRIKFKQIDHVHQKMLTHKMFVNKH